MNCKRCGAEIEEGSIYCTKCGKAIQMVPDYNPWDEVLDETIKKAAVTEGNPAEEFDRTFQEEAEKPENSSKNTKKAKPKKKKRSRKKIAALLIVLLLLLIVLSIFLVSYSNSNSYSYQMKKAAGYFKEESYENAYKYYKAAAALADDAEDAKLGMAKAGFAMHKNNQAENALLDILKENPNHKEACELLISYYEAQNRTEDIIALLDKCDDDEILEHYSAYISGRPSLSLPEGTYKEEQTVELRAESGSKIYYTLDGTDPTTNSTLYEEPIELKEGTTEVRAIAVTEKGVESRIGHAEYKIELEAPEAPDVQPNTGSYTEGAEITVSVPAGCRVYYTMDGSDPTSGSSRYEGPITMKEGDFLFSAMAIGENGKHSDIIRRNYSVSAKEGEE